MRRKTILILINPARFWRWQKWVAEALDGDFEISFGRVENAPALPAGLRLLFSLEKLLYGGGDERGCDLLPGGDIPSLAATADKAELVIDFSGTRDRPAGCKTIVPAFDGIAGDMGAVSALLEHRLPELGMFHEAGYSRLGLSANEEPLVLVRGLDQVFSRMAGLLPDFVRGRCRGQIEKKPQGSVPPVGAAALGFGLSTLSRKISARLRRLSVEAPRWAVGWRRIKGDAAYQTLSVSPDDFTRFRDDGQRYFADPFVFVHAGKTHVFCEEYPFATGRGLISAFTIEADGRASPARPVLERPYHLSYPFVFAHGGEIWMIPESSASRTLELYRAVEFPGKWVLERELLPGIQVDDATLHFGKNRLWLFGSTRVFNSSSWDALSLFSAPELMGEWTPHAANPVLCDARCARPGGALFAHDGALWRVAQDCSRGYGSGLALARISRLDDGGFAQEDVRYLAPCPTSEGCRDLQGMHTLNAAGGIEVIDMFGRFQDFT